MIIMKHRSTGVLLMGFIGVLILFAIKTVFKISTVCHIDRDVSDSHDGVATCI